MIRMIAKLSIVTLVAFLSVAPASAGPLGPFAWVSSAGNADDANACTVAQPCQSIHRALAAAGTGGQVNCIDSPGVNEGNNNITLSATIDCAGMITGFGGGLSPEIIAFSATNQVFKVRNLTFNGVNTINIGIKVTGSGTLIFENCVFENLTGTALDIEPTGALTLIIKNSRVSNNTGGVLIKPASGGSVTATFDGVTIVNNTGGLRTDTTNGAVKVDVANSSISYNTANGIVAIGGAGGNNMVTLKNDVIASNGQVGIDVSGTTAAVLVNNSVLDSNTTGATSAVSGGRILTYGNNSIIGPTGFGFTSSIPLQ
jgi:Right handed beta helix region